MTHRSSYPVEVNSIDHDNGFSAHPIRRAKPGRRYIAVRWPRRGAASRTVYFNTRCGAEAWAMKGYRARIYNSYGDLVWAWGGNREIRVSRVERPNTPIYVPNCGMQPGQPVEAPMCGATH